MRSVSKVHKVWESIQAGDPEQVFFVKCLEFGALQTQKCKIRSPNSRLIWHVGAGTEFAGDTKWSFLASFTTNRMKWKTPRVAVFDSSKRWFAPLFKAAPTRGLGQTSTGRKTQEAKLQVTCIRKTTALIFRAFFPSLTFCTWPATQSNSVNFLRRMSTFGYYMYIAISLRAQVHHLCGSFWIIELSCAPKHPKTVWSRARTTAVNFQRTSTLWTVIQDYFAAGPRHTLSLFCHWTAT